MTVYLYGLVDTDKAAEAKSALTGQPGVAGSAEVAVYEQYSLVWSAHDGGEILPRRRLLLAHAQILEKAMEFGTVLPMRFGMVSPSLCEFRTLAEQEADQIQSAFDLIRGRVEVGVRLRAPEAASLSATLHALPALAKERDQLQDKGPGAHFKQIEFGRRLGDAVAGRRSAAQKQVLGELCALAKSHSLKAPDTDFEVLRAEFLLDESALPEFSERLEALASTLEFCRPEVATAQLIGPGPAFHFVNVRLNTKIPEETF